MPSNSRIVQTWEDIPSSPPSTMQAGLINTTTGWVKWGPPLPQHHNGIILGYKLKIYDNSTKPIAQMTFNSSATYISVNNLTRGVQYAAKVAAFTRIGTGPYTPMTYFIDHSNGPKARPSESDHILLQPWFVGIIGVLGVVIFGGGLVFLRYYRRDKRLKSLRETKRGKDTALWIDEGWRPQPPGGKIETQIPEYVEVNKTTSFNNYHRPNPSPYATTMLINGVGPDIASLLPPPPEHPPPPTPLSQRLPIPPQRTASSQIYGRYCNQNPEYIPSGSGSQSCSHHSSSSRSHSCHHSCRDNSEQCSLPTRSSSSGKKRPGHRKPPRYELDSDTETDFSTQSPPVAFKWNNVEDIIRQMGKVGEDPERGSCSSCHDTCCSCSETSCLYAEAIPEIQFKSPMACSSR